ncbi:hypothetical protein SS50377_26707 [Spironucleus salmonicida]|uniref:Uncharacterized protein n=1 Tax=Spironucleus salmonicida TaxID=348837 RepID=V6M6Z3_9EUKA|nr:hypothetical protein SS50377_26707 [Spironucleus salmonicida]|eukprot:EST49179.1 Hypothetical protein SS50377_10394 [Spironucleus salmonicida]
MNNSKENQMQLPLDQDVDLEMNAQIYFTKLPNLRKYELNIMAPPKVTIKTGQEFEIFNYVSPVRQKEKLVNKKNPIQRGQRKHLKKIELDQIDSVEIYGLKSPVKVYESVIQFRQ